MTRETSAATAADLDEAASPGGAPAAPDRDWWRGAVIYQIYPRSFGDSNGDGIGDLPGITRRLAHVASLGADAVWLSPFMRSPMKDFGYDISDYRDVDPIFGTLDDFDALVAEAHRLGLKVIIDQVLSHTSDQHPWFKESRASRNNPLADWYVWAEPREDGSPPNNWISVFGGSSWEWSSTRRQYYLHNFLTSQPDLNFHHPAVRAAILADVRFWLDRGVDGFRLDTVNFYLHDAALRDNPVLPENKRSEVMAPRNQPYNFQDHVYDKNRPELIAFLRDFRALLDEYPAATSVGEVGERIHGAELMGEYTSGGDKLHMAYAFDFLSGAMPDVEGVKRVVERVTLKGADGWPCWAFSNHDVERHATRWAAGRPDGAAILRLAASLLLSLRGSVCLYQGEELGLTEAEIAFEDIVDPPGLTYWPEVKTRDGCRTPMVWSAEAPGAGFTQGAVTWLPIPPEHRPLAVDRAEADPGSLLQFYRAMIALRKAEPALTRGAIRFLDAAEGVLVFEREAEGRRLLCAFNLQEAPASLDAAHLRRLAALPASPLAGTVEDGGRRLALPGHGSFIGTIET